MAMSTDSSISSKSDGGSTHGSGCGEVVFTHTGVGFGPDHEAVTVGSGFEALVRIVETGEPNFKRREGIAMEAAELVRLGWLEQLARIEKSSAENAFGGIGWVHPVGAAGFDFG